MTKRLPLLAVLPAIVLAAPVHAATVTVTPARAVAGTVVAVKGSGARPGRLVALSIGTRSRPVRVRANRGGRFSATVPVPRRARLGPAQLVIRLGRRRVEAGVRIGRQRESVPSSRTVSSRGANVLLVPTGAKPGGGVRMAGQVRGRGMVAIGLGRRRLARTRAGRRGRFSLSFRAPGAPAGPRTLWLRARRVRMAVPFRIELPPPPPAAPAGTVRMAAAGDIACPPSEGPRPGFCQQAATADLVAGLHPDLVAALGDQQYESGTIEEFRASYDRSWGRFKAITRPVAGNHEYGVPGAAGYFDYFGSRAGPRPDGYYSFDAGAWRVLALNSNCKKVGGCGPGSPQYTWLRSELARTQSTCVMALWHHPLYTASFYPGEESSFMAPMFGLLEDAGADLVLTGHAHSYERFAPQTASGRVDRVKGVREFVIGSGGEDHRSIFRPLRPANLEAGSDTDFGVLGLTLRPSGYSWEFAAMQPSLFRDSGSAACH